MLRRAVTDLVSDSLVHGQPPLSHFQQEALAWLSGPTGLAHWWSPEILVLDEAVQALQVQADALTPAQGVCVFKDGDFLALLQRLNGLLAAAQRGESQAQAHAGQLWILESAERVSAEHIDILRRICLHYPELQIHLALFSQTAQAPVAAEGLQVHALQQGIGAAPVSGDAVVAAPSAGASARGWLIVGLVCVVVAVAGLLVWGWDQSPVQEAGQAAAGDQAQAPVAPSSAPMAPSSTAQEAPTPPQASSEAAAARVAEAAAPAKDVAVSASRRWLLSLPPASLAVVHAQTATLREAEGFRAGKAVLANARILQTSDPAATAQYLVVTGPFRSPDRAQNYIQRLEWKATARSIGREALLAQVPR